MKKHLKFILPIVILLTLVFVFWQAKVKPVGDNSAANSAQEVFASLKIGDTGSPSFDIAGFVGKTALEATKAKAEVITSGTGANAFVTSIDGRTADAKKQEFWEFDVNGSPAQVGAGSYIVQNHDQIIWKISNY